MNTLAKAHHNAGEVLAAERSCVMFSVCLWLRAPQISAQCLRILTISGWLKEDVARVNNSRLTEISFFLISRDGPRKGGHSTNLTQRESTVTNLLSVGKALQQLHAVWFAAVCQFLNVSFSDTSAMIVVNDAR